MTTWVKVYNSMPSHPKFVVAGDRAAWLFVCGCCYSNEHLTDGFIARQTLPVVAPGVKRPEQLAERLVAAELWEEVEGGWRIHDYGDYQRSAAEIRERRVKDAARKASVRGSSNGTPQDVRAESAQRPRGVLDVDVDVEEELPASTTSQQVARKRATRKTDQSKLPKGLTAELFPVLNAVLPILHRTWEERGGIEPLERGVALGILRNPRADHVRVALKLEHWLLAGRGQRARCADVAARFGDWVQDEGAALKLVDGGQESPSDLLDAMNGGSAA